MSPGPARGYKWPNATKGNALALKSGTRSPRAVAAVAEQLRPHLTAPLDDCAWLDEVDAAEVEDWLTREALLRMLVNELARRHDDNGGRFADADRWILERITAAQNRATASRDRLLLNPMSRFKAGRDVAAAGVDLARLWADDQSHGVNPAEIEPQVRENGD